MAGIGFVLRKLLAKNDIGGIVQAYLHATLAACGPWLFTVIALGLFYVMTGGYALQSATENFRVIILYNFSFSLVLSSALSLVSTRYLADMIYDEDVDGASGMLIGSLILLFFVGFAFIIPFYFHFADLERGVLCLAVLNFILVTSIWQVSIFISALKQYLAVSYSFICGLALAIMTGFALADSYGTKGILLGFNLGLGVILASLVALIFAEYPKPCRDFFRVVVYFKKQWKLALGAVAYSMGIWIDKWLMWFTPEAETFSNGLVMYPYYDSAMFLAYLTVVPAMAMFLISQETSFFESYLKFYQDIQKHANFQKIVRNHELMLNCIAKSGLSLLLLQGCISFLVLISAPKILELLGMNFVQLSMFRYGVIGAAFQVWTLFLVILLSYFDNKGAVLFIQSFFFFSNLALTSFFSSLGFAWYGYGYFLSALMTFVIAALIAEKYIRKLPYYSFVINNASVET